METTSISTQKKLMYIPILNVINYWLLFLNLRRVKVSMTSLIELILSILGYTLPIGVGFSIAAKLFPGLYWVFYFCTIYLGPLSMSYVSIRFQEKNL